MKNKKSFELDVNGLVVSIDVSPDVDMPEKPLYTLLKAGDYCLVTDNGIVRKGKVKSVIRLSKGKMLFSVDLLNHPLKDWDMYEGPMVEPEDPMQCLLRITAYEMLLRRYEPKGMSLNVSLFQ